MRSDKRRFPGEAPLPPPKAQEFGLPPTSINPPPPQPPVVNPPERAMRISVPDYLEFVVRRIRSLQILTAVTMLEELIEELHDAQPLEPRSQSHNPDSPTLDGGAETQIRFPEDGD